MSPAVVFYVVAIVLFILAGLTLPRGNPPAIHLGWFGMASFAIGVWLTTT